MVRLSRFFFKFFLTIIGLSVLVLGAAGSSQAAVHSQRDNSSASSGVTSGIDNALQTAQEEIRDPFAIAAETEAAVTAATTTSTAMHPEAVVVLQGIGFGSKDGYAVIGNDIYYIGTELNGIKLLEVRRREVDILVNGGRTTVPLFKGEEVEKAKKRAKKKEAVKDAPTDSPSQIPSPLSEREQSTL